MPSIVATEVADEAMPTIAANEHIASALAVLRSRMRSATGGPSTPRSGSQ
jgi:hypothetical protein